MPVRLGIKVLAVRLVAACANFLTFFELSFCRKVILAIFAARFKPLG
jgi:hypothetical protein